MTKRTAYLLGVVMVLIVCGDSFSAEPPGTPEDKDGAAKPELVVHPLNNDLITVNLEDVDIREAISVLSMKQEMNIVTAQEVSGRISVHLHRVPVQEALEAITLAGGCNYQKQGDIYYIYKPKVAKDPEAGRLQIRNIQLKYADPKKIQGILDSIPGKRMIKIHEPTKTVVVEDSPENIEKIESIVRFLDKTPKQVLIEAKILDVSLTDDMSLGVNWEQILGDARIGTGGLSRAILPTVGGVSPVPGTGAGLFGNVITAAGTRHQFAAAIDALREKTKVNILSTPKILAIHGETARVQVGGQQGYKESILTSTGLATESIKFIETGTILEITPFIGDDGNILLNVKPSIKTAKIEEDLPVVNTTEASTWLLSKDGETVFIGGLIQDSKTDTRDMIPCLGSIPGLGPLFSRTTTGTRKSELVILITSHISEVGKRPGKKDAIANTKKTEELLKREPRPDSRQVFELFFPPDQDPEKEP
jgi:type IV pilus assembly protein PilQ